MTVTSYFEPGFFEFFLELRANNERAWFQGQRARYESVVKEPLLRFIADFDPRLREISPNYEADARPVGGSMFRIHRDTRFSNDKSPYKTHAAAHFRHVAARDVHTPGYYLQLAPGGCLAAAGIWRPDAAALEQIRRAILEQPDAWAEVRAQVSSLGGASLKRPPRGYDPAHPAIEDLKRKELIARTIFSDVQVCQPDFLAVYSETCRAMSVLVRFLTRALGLAW